MRSFSVRAWRLGFALSAVVLATNVFATSFVVPTDEELIEKSHAIIRGIVSSAEVGRSATGHIETVYAVAVTRSLKGPVPEGTFVDVRSLGGALDDRILIVESSAHFREGDEVLLFLTQENGLWSPTDMTLGKFRPALTTKGYSVLVRDEEDIVGWTREGKPHVEKVRLEMEFIRFIEDTVHGRRSTEPYEAEAAEVLAPPPPRDARWQLESNALFPANTYATQYVGCDDTRFAGRWSDGEMSAGVSYFKNSANNLSGAGDGGVSSIEAGLAAWTDDCNSAINIGYAGTGAELATGGDLKNMVVFNDPQGLVSGTWTGSGTIGIAFTLVSGTPYTHPGGGLFLDLVDSDIVFQNGYTASEPSLEEAMTHEIGHAIGFRHSNQGFQKTCTIDDPCTVSCSTPACSGSQECSSSAIMNSSAVSNLGYTLQAWDQSAANALYPGTCGGPAPAAPTNVFALPSTGSTVFISWSGSDGATSYSVWRSTGGAFAEIGTPDPEAATSFVDLTASVNAGYQYAVMAHNASGDSPLSGSDVAVNVDYTDPTITSGMSVKAAHLTELRTAANLLTALAGLAAPSYTDSTITAGVTTVKAVHFQEVESALHTAMGDLGMGVPGLLGIAADGAVLPSHINTLRTYGQ